MKSPQKFDFIINRRAGTVLAEGEAEVSRNLADIFGQRAGEIRFVEGQEIQAAVRDWVQINAGTEKGIIIGGGDGSILGTVPALLGRNLPLGILPLGTQNFVARELGFSPDYKTAAAQYKNSVVTKIDVGQVNDRYFLYGLLVDRNSVRFFEGREALRAKNYSTFLKKTFAATAGALAGVGDAWEIARPGTEEKPFVEKGHVIAVTNNIIIPRRCKARDFWHADWRNMAGDMFAKGQDHKVSSLGLYAFKGSFLNPLLLLSLWRGKWDHSRGLSVHEAAQFRMAPAGPAHQSEADIVIDGEIERLALPLDVKIMPQSLTVFQPR